MRMCATDATALTAKRISDSFGSGNPNALEREQGAFGSFGSPDPSAHSARRETAGALSITVHTFGVTDRGIQCATPAAPEQPFWLP
jgi:hypothetical protein